MAMEQPKKPAGGGYGVYVAENRDRIKATLPTGHKITDVSKKGGEQWKALSEAQKKPYVAKYEQNMAAYKTAMEKFLAEGGEKAAKKEKKEKKEKKDPNAPKKPAGGGYGVYVAENRDRITASLPTGHKITDVSKKGGAEWKALSEAQKKPYVAKYEQKMAAYKTAMEEYKKTNPEAEDEEEGEEEDLEDVAEESEEVVEAPAAKKRAAEASAESPPAKKGRGRPTKAKAALKGA